MASPSINNQPGQVSGWQLKISYWYVTHKFQLRRGLILSLIILIVLLYGYSLFRLFSILVLDYQDNQRALRSLTTNLIDYQYFHQTQKPSSLQIANFTVVGNQENGYDFVARIANPNEDFVATDVLVRLVNGNQTVAEKRIFIYPKEEKYVAIFGQKDVSREGAVLQVANVEWQRVRQFSEFSQSRLNFVVSDVQFLGSGELNIKGASPVSSLTFKITNDTAYSYWQTGISMVLLSGEQVVGANYLILSRFLSGETREVEMRWYESLPSVTDVKILPEVNILDAAVYMPAVSE